MAVPEQETTYYTEEEYLAYDLADDRPNEYNFDRTVTRREGRSLAHVTISGNVVTSLHTQVLEVEAFVFSSLMRVKVERYLRQDEFNWLNTIFKGSDATIELPSIGCTLKFSDIYRRVNFEGAE